MRSQTKVCATLNACNPRSDHSDFNLMSNSRLNLQRIAITLLLIPGLSAYGYSRKPLQETSAAQLVKDGMTAYNNKDYAQAAKLLEQAVARGSNQNDVLYNAACSFALAGDREKAFRFLERAIRAGYRDTTHLKSDTDFNSLHDDPRWPKMIAACDASQAAYVKERGDPANARFITSDIERFWRAYDKAMSAPVEERAAILQHDYIDPGTAGVKGFAASGRLNAKTLAQRIESHQAFFKAIRPLTLAVEQQRPATIAAFRKLKEIYSSATFPDVYFLIGQLSSGGTSSNSGLLMGAEMFSRSASVPTAELNDWERSVIAPASDIPPLVAHESIHFQQRFAAQGGLLCACLIEGGADFVGKLSSGRLIARMEETHKWANERERVLWIEFQKEMDGKDTSHWLYGNSGGNGRPVDLGYWMGFKINEAYYNNATDKKQAVRDILAVTDCKQFLERSRYGDKFDASPRQK